MSHNVRTLKQASSALGMMFSPQLGSPSQARLRDMHSRPFFCWKVSSVGHSYSAPSDRQDKLENCLNCNNLTKIFYKFGLKLSDFHYHGRSGPS